MRKLIAALVLSAFLVVGWVVPATAHIEGNPCVATDEPGHSEYAQHHVAAQAQLGLIGTGGHAPGVHRGFSSCL